METPNQSGNAAKAKSKTSVSETGHAKNVANFQDVIAFVSGYGANYNPTKASLKLPALTALFAAGQQNLSRVITSNTAFNNAVNDRAATFDDLRTLSTRIIAAFEATDAAPAKIEDAKGFNMKLQGKRSGKVVKVLADPTAPAPETISVSQQSYDQLIEHFGGFISVLQSEPTYAPNEAALKVAVLIAKRTDMMAKNAAVATAYAAISNERIARNKTIYGPAGIVDTAEDVKKYVKSLYGATSPEYAQVKGIPFKGFKK